MSEQRDDEYERNRPRLRWRLYWWWARRWDRAAARRQRRLRWFR